MSGNRISLRTNLQIRHHEPKPKNPQFLKPLHSIHRSSHSQISTIHQSFLKTGPSSISPSLYISLTLPTLRTDLRTGLLPPLSQNARMSAMTASMQPRSRRDSIMVGLGDVSICLFDVAAMARLSRYCFALGE